MQRACRPSNVGPPVPTLGRRFYRSQVKKGFLNMHATMVRLFVVAGLVICALPFIGAPAQAHATLVKCSIAPGAVLSSSPKMLTCTFAEGVNPKGSLLGVFEATGDKGSVDAGNSQVSFSNVKQMSVGLPKLGAGVYGVLWYTVSADDGHKAGGYFTFSIKK